MAMDTIEGALAYAARFRAEKVHPASAAASLVTLADEVERLRAIAGDVRAAWVGERPDARMAIRRQSEAVYCTLGALATQLRTGA